VLHLDDASDGSGNLIGTRQVAVGGALSLYAVSRWPDGLFFRSEEVTWSTVGGSGTLTEATSSALFSPTGAGSSTVSAESTLFGTASAIVETAGCTVVADCVDDPCRSESCQASLCVVGAVDKDTDGDSFFDIACGGTDCDDSTNLRNPGILEGPEGDATCSDGLDNDCDTALDALDTGCVAATFTAPVLIAEIAAIGFDDVAPTATGDLLEMFFESDRGGGSGAVDIWTSTRASVMDPWGAPTNVTEFNTIDREASPGVSSDGLRMYFSSDRPGSIDRDIWFSSRATRTAPWTAPVHEDVLSSADKERTSAENSSGLLLIVERQVLGTFDLFERALVGGIWSLVRTLTELDSPGVTDDQPCLVGDNGLQVFFTSDRAGGVGLSDIWTATRPNTSSAFTAAINVPELNSAAIEEGVWVAPDLSYVLFTSERTGEKKIYEAFLQ
jgi:hypothetical protein